ncbi:hypothetical protein NQ315_000281 [Exocentrus adspersus]|uniref:Cyclic nucleotide-binding domain-containing protein n=1 Tax=Exocentrus adspersus TaxID=1586481 RepID=A0AAV8VQB4_9CUCU|nr:hypothetical protein NQ315_000281 [Exocentrus adspersus]
MTETQHECSLLVKDPIGSKRLAPNASTWEKLLMKVKDTMLLNPQHINCNKFYRNKAMVREDRRKHSTGPYVHVIHPLSRMNLVLSTCFFVVWIVLLIFITVRVNLTMLKNRTTLHLIDGILNPIQALLILFQFDVGYMDEKTQTVVLEPKKIIWKYLTTYFIFDTCASALPIYTAQAVVEGYYPNFELYLHLRLGLYWLRIFSFYIRIQTLKLFINDILTVWGLTTKLRFLLISIVMTYIHVHILSAAVYYIGAASIVFNGEESVTWLNHVKDSTRQPDDQLGFWYFHSVRLTFCYFFGVFNHYEIMALQEQILLSAITLFGRLYTLYLLADVLNTFGLTGITESFYEHNMSVLNGYMDSNGLPYGIRKRMLRYYKYKFQGRYFNEEEIIETLSQKLRTELFIFSARKLFAHVSILHKVPTIMQGVLVSHMISEIYSAKDVIVPLGFNPEQISFIATGTVAIINKHNHELCHLEDGDVFGDDFLVRKQNNYAVVAVENTEVFSIYGNQFVQLMKPYPNILREMCHNVNKKFARLKEVERKLELKRRDIVSDLADGDVLEEFTVITRVV